jgi:hypothetical protein
MSVIVSLQDIVNAVDLPNPKWESLLDQWYAYRQSSFEQIAPVWLESHGIAYE